MEMKLCVFKRTALSDPPRNSCQRQALVALINAHSKIAFLLNKLFTTEGHEKRAFKDKFLSLN